MGLINWIALPELGHQQVLSLGNFPLISAYLQSTSVFSTILFLSVLFLHMHFSNHGPLASNLWLLLQKVSILSQFVLLEDYVFFLASGFLCKVSPLRPNRLKSNSLTLSLFLDTGIRNDKIGTRHNTKTCKETTASLEFAILVHQFAAGNNNIK